MVEAWLADQNGPARGPKWAAVFISAFDFKIDSRAHRSTVDYSFFWGQAPNILDRHQQHFVKCVFLCRLSGYGVTEEVCSSLASAVTSNPSSQLKQLDLNFSHLGGSGLKKLSAALETLK